VLPESVCVINQNASPFITSTPAFGFDIRAELPEETRMLNDAAIARLRANLGANVIQSGDPSYEEARKVFNGMI
jgi:hypothetical protein